MVTKNNSTLPFMLRMMRFNVRILTFLSPPLAARLVNYLWFKTRRYDEPKREQKYLQTAIWQTLRVNDKTIQLYIWGENNKPTVLLVHGWNGRGAQLGAFTESFVEEGYRVITFDAPGHGRSSAKSTNLPEISRVIQNIAKEFGPLKTGIAHSFGGLCLMHAVTEGIKIDKAVFIGTAFNAERLVEVFSRILDVQPKIIERHKKLLEQQFGEDLWDRFSMPKMVKKTTIQGLIIHDEDDDSVPVERSKMIAKEWENSELVLTIGLGHRRILRDKMIIKKVTEFNTQP